MGGVSTKCCPNALALCRLAPTRVQPWALAYACCRDRTTHLRDKTMFRNTRTFALRATALAAFAASLTAAAAAQPIKVGVALDISGPFAGPGAEIKDGLNLAAKLLDNKLGGVPAEFIQADMAGNPETARQLVDRFVKRDKVDFFTGPVGSNVVLAVGPTLFGAKVPSATTGKLSRAASPPRDRGRLVTL